MRQGALAVLLLIANAAALAAQPAHLTLTFEDRMRAQEAIERVYYSYQVGATIPFEQAVPREALQKKVIETLKRSVALEALWGTPVTAEMLRSELDRISRDSRLPERLRRIYEALGNDSVLIQECFARPVLVDRLSRNFFSMDQRIHADSRSEARSLQERLLRGGIDVRGDDPRRSVAELRVIERPDAKRPDMPEELGMADDRRVPVREISREERDRLISLAGDMEGRPGPVVEEADRFVIRASLESAPGRTVLATWIVPKRSWDEWWSETAAALDVSRAGTVAFPLTSLPSPAVPASSPDDVWDNGALDDVPEARRDHSAVWTGTVMIVWGGGSQSRYTNTGGRYDPLTDTWTPISTLSAPQPRSGHTAVWTGARMIVWGGHAQDSSPLDTGGEYDPIADAWSATSTVGAPPARTVHTAVWTGTRMIVWGGVILGSTPLNTGGSYDPSSGQWTATSTAGAPVARYRHTAVWTGNRMIVWGGYNNGTYFDTGAQYNPATNTWSPTSNGPPTFPPTARADHTAVWTGSRMVIWGGETTGSTRLNTGGRYDPVGNFWDTVSLTSAPVARSKHTAVWTGSRMVVWGGYSSGYTNSGGRYDPAANVWQAMSTTNAPAGRESHTMVWAGDRSIVWGGYDGIFLSSSGGRYDPAADIWTPTAVANQPTPRFFHSAVWTGSLMIIWGGGVDPLSTATGGRYDPLVEAWSPTSTTLAPSARSFHTAIWTGNVMVVWGGGGLASGTNTGGRYNPLSDTWLPTSTSNAPSSRTRHSAVWTGSRMIVWGGSGLSNVLNTGGLYDPVADAWETTATLDAPLPRANHTAVWAGSEMIVWGGTDQSLSAAFGTGGRYDPTSNSWQATSDSGAPLGRKYHTAVWTGDSMIVWGGTDSSGSGLASGSRYDASSNTWQALSNNGAPTAYRDHTATWTGSMMVVWGGSAPGGFVATGRRYSPASDSWTPTALTGAPTARGRHTAVWTGELMVVWGGSGNAELNTGGRYSVKDADADGAGDAYDCAPADAGSYAQPQEVANLTETGTGTTSLTWQGQESLAGAGVLYDVVTGSIADLSSGAGFSGSTCLAAGLTSPASTDENSPGASDGFYYLVRARNACGFGTYGPGRGALDGASPCP